MKKQTLEVGQRVWLERTSFLGSKVKKEEELKEMIVLKANKSNAYIWYEENEHRTRYKVEQKTHKVSYAIPDGCTYRLWLSKEEYEHFVVLEKEMTRLRKEAHDMINKMTLQELRELVR